MGGFKVEGVITDHNNKEDMRARLRQLSSYGRGKCRQRDKNDLTLSTSIWLQGKRTLFLHLFAHVIL